MTHREAIQRLTSLRDLLTETLGTIVVKPTDGGDGHEREAEVATVLMRVVWQGYLEAIEHAIEQLGRLEGLEH